MDQSDEDDHDEPSFGQAINKSRNDLIEKPPPSTIKQIQRAEFLASAVSNNTDAISELWKQQQRNTNISYDQFHTLLYPYAQNVSFQSMAFDLSQIQRTFGEQSLAFINVAESFELDTGSFISNIPQYQTPLVGKFSKHQHGYRLIVLSELTTEQRANATHLLIRSGVKHYIYLHGIQVDQSFASFTHNYFCRLVSLPICLASH